MPDPPFDVAVANRFISSLSKSLQALCHGCMDFDSGIEIVGYINVNIDCGSKADYVLNEKVMKSTTNSMTFVSNSFLAKKDQPKQTRDGACSPIPQFSAVPFHNRSRGFSHGSHGRSEYHGAYYRGAQKRGFSGDWRSPHKRPRPMPNDRGSFNQYPPSVSTQGLHSETFSSDSFRQTNYQHQSDTVNTNSGSNGDASTVNIKKETFESSEEAQPSQDNSGQQANSGSESVPSSLNIKTDPDGSSVTATEGSSANEEISENNDFKGTFLQPTSQDNQDNADTAQPSESRDQMSSSEQTVGFETPFPNLESLSETGGDESSSSANVPAESVSNAEAGGNEPEDNTVGDEAAVEYDNATEESYSEYPDAGEGSSSGQFEVIEIDDEDEDMQAMFGASQKASSSSIPHKKAFTLQSRGSYVRQSSTSQSLSHNKDVSSIFNQERQTYACVACGKEYKSSSGARHHFKIKHCGLFDHYCQVCGKGFQQRSHLRSHMSIHMQHKEFKCNVCGFQYVHKTSLTAHQKLAHGIYS